MNRKTALNIMLALTIAYGCAIGITAGITGPSPVADVCFLGFCVLALGWALTFLLTRRHTSG
jgi:pyruvate/2-oxoglutarate/acetoin dehydrogenase E1 component